MTDDDLFREALRAHAPEPAIPAGFAERVTTLATARPTPRRTSLALVALAACAVAAFAWQTRAREGEVSVPATATAPRQVWLGDRARVVLEPGTTLRYRVGGWSPRRRDVVELASGSGFFRVDRGGGFEVRAPHGTVRVTGTCFRVSAAANEREATMTGAARARWFGAGASTVALAVAVFEGGVTLARPSHAGEVHLGPGESARVLRDGTLSRGDGARVGSALSGASSPASAPGAGRDDATAPRAALEQEVARLRAILTAHHLSPDTGDAAAPARRGIESDGETDLTPEEWRQLAERGELRFTIPGSGGRDPDARVARQAQELGLREHEVTGVREVFRREHERLLGELRALYREAAGTDPGNLSLDALQSEIRDKTPAESVTLVDLQLARERGGLAERPAGPVEATSPYERMMRSLVSFERRLEESIAALVGAADAHALMHGPNAVGGHSYGRTSQVGDAGAR